MLRSPTFHTPCWSQTQMIRSSTPYPLVSPLACLDLEAQKMLSPAAPVASARTATRLCSSAGNTKGLGGTCWFHVPMVTTCHHDWLTVDWPSHCLAQEDLQSYLCTKINDLPPHHMSLFPGDVWCQSPQSCLPATHQPEPPQLALRPVPSCTWHLAVGWHVPSNDDLMMVIIAFGHG